LEVVATDGAIEIEDFPGQEQAWLQAALHVLKIHLSDFYPSGRDLGLGDRKSVV
jgi:hypothetical protein